jgi:hypothetical protein
MENPLPVRMPRFNAGAFPKNPAAAVYRLQKKPVAFVFPMDKKEMD